MLKNKPVLVFIGTYPPRECGIATFTQDLLRSSRRLLGKHISCRVAALNITPLDNYIYPKEVKWQISQNIKKEYLDFAKKINADPLVSGVILQHEYGIYGDGGGANILAFMENCKKPILVTLHTILPKPTIQLKEITSRIIHSAQSIVVLTENSRQILENSYPFAIGKTYVVPHGIHATPFNTTAKAKMKLKIKNHFVLSTFGLLSKGKGIEYVIKALPAIINKYPDLIYLVLGATHPVVRRSDGEKYRIELAKLVNKLHLAKNVKFYDQYLDLQNLIEFLKATDIYVSTSINPNQSVSGTLSYALGTGRAVISTEFAQAKEIVTPNVGKLVPIKKSSAITTAIFELLKNEKNLRKMHHNAYLSTRPMLWSNVARQYTDLLTQVVLPPINLNHLKNMTDDFGLFQFAKFSKPNKKFGYTLDDNARALIVCIKLKNNIYKIVGIDKLIKLYFNFIIFCQKDEGSFINYVDINKKETAQNANEDLSDTAGRVIWSLAELVASKNTNDELKSRALQIINKALQKLNNLEHLRAKAFLIKAYSLIVPINLEKIEILANEIALDFKKNSSENWQWFELQISYNNGLLPEAMLIAGKLLGRDDLLKIGQDSLQFLIKETFSTNLYLPIGNNGWYKQDLQKAVYDQQPEDPSAMIFALITAYKIIGYESYLNLANKCFSWYLGNNSLHLPLYNYENGGCFDGVEPNKINQNQGAESLVSYLLSRLAITEIKCASNN